MQKLPLALALLSSLSAVAQESASPPPVVEQPDDTAPPADDTAPPVDDTAPPADDTAPPVDDTAPPPENKAEPAPSAPREPAVGDDVGGWKVLALTGQKRLVDGRVSEEVCGYLRDVIVEKGPRVERTVLEVPCVDVEGGLQPGSPRLRFDAPAVAEPAAIKRGMPVTFFPLSSALCVSLPRPRSPCSSS